MFYSDIDVFQLINKFFLWIPDVLQSLCNLVGPMIFPYPPSSDFLQPNLTSISSFSLYLSICLRSVCLLELGTNTNPFMNSFISLRTLCHTTLFPQNRKEHKTILGVNSLSMICSSILSLHSSVDSTFLVMF